MGKEIKVQLNNLPTKRTSRRPGILTQVCLTSKSTLLTIAYPDLGGDNSIAFCNDITPVNVFLILCDSL